MKNKSVLLALTSVAVLLCGLAAQPVSAQTAVPPPMPAYQPLSDQQLDQLLGPIALYPDPLLAQILPASTLPTQIVLADRYLAGGGDPNLANQQPWDPSVQALTRYPTVLQYLDNNLGWTTELGQAFLNQQQQVMDSVQRLRMSAQNFGNLQSTPQQQVVDDGGEIEILPVDPAVVYVPIYQPAYVYYQGGYGLGFGVACAIGPWLNCDFDWRGRQLRFCDQNHPRPANWWREAPNQRTAWLARQGTVWRAEDHRNIAAPSGGDRGWNNTVVRNNTTVIRNNTTVVRNDTRNNNMIVNMSHPEAAPRPTPTARPAAGERPAAARETGAFIGSDNSRDVRNFSNRGQESMQTVTHSEPVRNEAPAPRPAPSESGGGFHGGGGGSQPHR
jgi:hypothetical protein